MYSLKSLVILSAAANITLALALPQPRVNDRAVTSTPARTSQKAATGPSASPKGGASSKSGSQTGSPRSSSLPSKPSSGSVKSSPPKSSPASGSIVSTRSSGSKSATKPASVSSSRPSRSASASSSSARPSGSCPSNPPPKPERSADPNRPVMQNQYWIVLDEKTDVKKLADKVTAVKEKSPSTIKNKVIDTGDHYFAAELGSAALEFAKGLGCKEGVLDIQPVPKFKTPSVTEDQVERRNGALMDRARGTQRDASWNLQRITQAQRMTLSGGQRWGDRTFRYKPAAHGEGVRVYILDHGINRNHDEFRQGARIERGWIVSTVPGQNVDLQGSVDDDDTSHGTAMAGWIVGAHTGVAKDATVVPVKLRYDADGDTSATWIIKGIRGVIADHAAQTGPAVINISADVYTEFQYAYQDPLAQEIKRATDAGIHVVAAAGNSFQNWCDDWISSPALPFPIINVGGTDHDDAISRSSSGGGSNFGQCLDLFAPSKRVLTLHNGSPTGFNWATGTSHAAPQVAAAIAIIAGNGGYGDAAPATMKQTLLGLAVNAVRQLPSGHNTPRKLLQVLV